MNPEDVISSLPLKGERRIKAILELGADEANARPLLELAETEKGKCKIAAQRALAHLNCAPAAPLWKKLVNGKYMGEAVLMPSCSDCVSEQIAPVIRQYFSELFGLPQGAALSHGQLEKLRFCISIMLGKSSPAMCEVYRLAASNTEWIRHIKKEAAGDEKKDFWNLVSGFITIWEATPEELEKIFPAILAASIIKSRDTRLINLARELYEKHGGSWLIPVFTAAIITEPKETVYEEFSRYLSDGKSSVYLYNVFGMLYYEDYPALFSQNENYAAEHKKGYYALIFWGSYAYGLYDTRCSFKCPVELDERWLFRLAENPNEKKPKVALQTYNRRMGGVKYEDYDEMLLELLPLTMQEGSLKQILSDYFSIHAKSDNGETSLYRDARERFLN